MNLSPWFELTRLNKYTGMHGMKGEIIRFFFFFTIQILTTIIGILEPKRATSGSCPAEIRLDPPPSRRSGDPWLPTCARCHALPQEVAAGQILQAEAVRDPPGDRPLPRSRGTHDCGSEKLRHASRPPPPQNRTPGRFWISRWS